MEEDFIPISHEECIRKYGKNETIENGKFLLRFIQIHLDFKHIQKYKILNYGFLILIVFIRVLKKFQKQSMKFICN